jgi:hypothetical protein
MLIESTLPLTGRSQEPSSATAAAPLVFRHTRIETRPDAAEPSLAPLVPQGRVHEGLEAQPGSTAAGGVIVDLNGRMGSLLVMQPGSDGTFHATCVEHPSLGLTR